MALWHIGPLFTGRRALGPGQGPGALGSTCPRALGSGPRALGPGPLVPGLWALSTGPGPWSLVHWSRVHWSQALSTCPLVPGPWALVHGSQGPGTLPTGHGPWAFVHWSLALGYWSLALVCVSLGPRPWGHAYAAGANFHPIWCPRRPCGACWGFPPQGPMRTLSKASPLRKGPIMGPLVLCGGPGPGPLLVWSHY